MGLLEKTAQERVTQAKYLWGLFLFLLVVVLFIDPFDFSYARLDVSAGGPSLEEFVSAMRQGTIVRQLGLFLLAIFGVLTLLIRKQDRPGVNGVSGILVLFYIGWAVLSVMWSDNVGLAVRRVGILVCLSVGALALAQRLSLREIMVATLFISGVTLVTAVLAHCLAGKFSPFDVSWRFAGVMHPYGQARNCGLMAIASVVLYRLSARHRLSFLILLIVALLFLVLTKSRIPFVGAVIGVSTCWILLTERPRRLVITWLIVLIAAASVGYIVFEKEMRIIPNVITSFGRGEEGEQSASDLTGRVGIWEGVLREAIKRPILGHGYNAFFTPYYLKRISQEIGYTPSNVHNGYIENFFGLGLVGLVAFLAILLVALRVSLKLFKENSEYVFVVAVLVWLCCILGFESVTLSRPTFPTLLCMILFAKLAFFRGVVWIGQS